jgi:hypothetical protein
VKNISLPKTSPLANSTSSSSSSTLRKCLATPHTLQPSSLQVSCHQSKDKSSSVWIHQLLLQLEVVTAVPTLHLPSISSRHDASMVADSIDVSCY